nr:unnamed protein product [Callosobruchus chinensis]
MELGQEQVKVKSEPEDAECEPSVQMEGTSSIFYNLLVKSEDTTNYDNPEFLNCLTLRREFEELDSPISPANNNCIEEQNQVEAESTDSDHGSSSDEYEDEISCKVCNQQFGDDEELQLHHKTRRLADRSYKCCGCEKIFRDNTQLIVHTRKHTGEKPFTCKICGKNFSVNGNLSKHMRIHTGDRPYQCETCKFGFKTKARLRKHEKSHEGTKITKRTVQCPLCSKLMRNIKQLMAHLESQHEDDSAELFRCQLCPKSYRNVFSLNHHMRVHGAKDFQCTICEKAFTSASHLRRHLNSHTGVRPFLCQVCLRPFPSQQNMKRHMMTHTGEKPFSCDQCGRSFLTQENLNRHKRTHTGEKPFPCNICGRFFAHSTTAKEHMRTHTGDKPFICTICNKSFAINKALYKHTREKHPDYFPEFKEFNDLPPNVKRARKKMKIEVPYPQETAYSQNQQPATASVIKTEDGETSSTCMESNLHQEAEDCKPDLAKVKSPPPDEELGIPVPEVHIGGADVKPDILPVVKIKKEEEDYS